ARSWPRGERGAGATLSRRRGEHPLGWPCAQRDTIRGVTPMAVATAEVEYTPEDLLAMSEGFRYELVEGRLVERAPLGAKANRIGMVLRRWVDAFAAANALGICFAENCGYQCFPFDSRRVRLPDGSFVRTGRLPDDKPPDGHMRIAPDLVLEVVSPNDLA